LIEELIPKLGKSVGVVEVAECYASLADRDEFFSWIDKAGSAKNIQARFLRYDLNFDKVRDLPRFPEVFKKLGLPY
jgi:hypothetical protein